MSYSYGPEALPALCKGFKLPWFRYFKEKYKNSNKIITMIIKRLNTTKTQIKNIKKNHKTTAVPS